MSVLRAVFRVLISAAAVAVLVVTGYTWHLKHTAEVTVQRITGAITPTEPKSTDGDDESTPDDQGTTILLLGSDARVGADAGSGVTGERADVIMLARIAPHRGAVNVLSIPRDSWVDIPGRGYAKINAALAYGGIPLAVRTVEQVSGVHVDHVVEVGFGVVRELTTLLGGVTVTLPEASTDPLTNTTFDAGENVLEGDRALTFVRQRYGLPGGDLDRIARQHQLLFGALARVRTLNPLGQPLLLDRLTRLVSSSVAIDEGLTVTDLFTLADQVSRIGSGRVRFATAAVASLGTSPDGQSIVNLDADAFAAQCAALARDEPIPAGRR
ncbi:LCP family protein [Saccharothrix violaceirubra]|uniref:LCP family protein required for cell wall assembly n=1 Tax=Saccharothrix violaceirubra TaxID=413306 RepID=A0A7W7T158_9PSEU|nr:LCP family protein [Saccharothrix violaceirubra]MBB4963375.1 LCP family protein required for cell wall assembly [Saccharothrix violaceirubra]